MNEKNTPPRTGFEAFDPVSFADDAIANATQILQSKDVFDGDGPTVLRRKLNAAETDVDAALHKLDGACAAGVPLAEEQRERLRRFRQELVPEDEKSGHPVWEGEVLAQAVDWLRGGGEDDSVSRN